MTRDNCCGCAGCYENAEQFFFFTDTGDPANPPADVDIDAISAELLAKDWADLAALAYREDTVRDDPQPKLCARAKVRFEPGASGSYTEYTFPDFDIVLDPGEIDAALSLGIFTVAPLNAATVYPDADHSLQFRSIGLQSCGWFYTGDRGVDDPNVRAFATRSRHRYPVDTTAFIVQAELWCSGGGSSYGWANFSGRQPGFLNYRNWSLVTDDFTAAAGDWIEPGFPDTSPSPSGGFADGFLGRLIFVVRNETRAAWEARTGITL